jgi:small-conductance mechanosensitive channel
MTGYSKIRLWLPALIFLSLAGGLFWADLLIAGPVARNGMPLLRLMALVAMVPGLVALASLASYYYLEKKKKPITEWMMVNHLYWLLGVFAGFVVVFYGLGILGKVGTLLSLFGGMVIGWSLQQPISGLVAWVLINLRRPFRPGDRVQFPKLELTGDIKNIGAMYTELNEVGGTIGSEEAVGRSVFIPNAMLFDQVAINYASAHEAPYILDEIIVRITYDSKWDVAEQILIDAAQQVTQDVIEATGKKPYIRSELYDYGVYMQLRYQTRVKDRAKTSYKITKLIFEEIQHNPLVDIAIPYVYSYRSGRQERLRGQLTGPNDEEIGQNIREIDLSLIEHGEPEDSYDVEQLARSIETIGLLRPVVLKENPDLGRYEILAGELRFQACRKLGWKTMPALVLANPGDNSIEQQPPPPASEQTHKVIAGQP